MSILILFGVLLLNVIQATKIIDGIDVEQHHIKKFQTAAEYFYEKHKHQINFTIVSFLIEQFNLYCKNYPYMDDQSRVPVSRQYNIYFPHYWSIEKRVDLLRQGYDIHLEKGILVTNVQTIQYLTSLGYGIPDSESNNKYDCVTSGRTIITDYTRCCSGIFIPFTFNNYNIGC